MKTQVILNEPLADLCRRRCSRCAPDDHNGAGGRVPVLFDEPEDGPPAVIRKRRMTFPYPRCDRCEFLLLMQGIDRLIPREEQADWLREPNVDLGGLSPAECIEQGSYGPVFMALFFLDPCGPVS
jgi:hypothetical protein